MRSVIALIVAENFTEIGELPAIQVGGRGQWRVEKVRFEQWVEQRHQETAQAVRAGASLD